MDGGIPVREKYISNFFPIVSLVLSYTNLVDLLLYYMLSYNQELAPLLGQFISGRNIININ